jgi:hypothetical protein
MRIEWLRIFGLLAKSARRLGQTSVVGGVSLCWVAMSAPKMACTQALNTTTVQGTVYLANGQPGAGTLVVSWPAFTTAAGQAIVADSATVTIPPDGFLSVNLAPNVGATPAGEYYTSVFYMSDGSTSTQYWVVPAAAQSTLAQVESQVMPAAQAVQTVSKAYVDQSISELNQSLLAASGGNLSGPLYLNADPTQPLQAADKHYVDTQVATALPLSGGTLSGSMSATQIGAMYQADQFPGTDFGSKLQACLNALNANYGGTCDARNFAGSQTMGSNLTIATASAAVLLPCATISTANRIIVAAGTRNVALHGCAMRGGSAASGSQGGTVFAYTGTGAMVQVGDPTYATDTLGFHMDDFVINTTGATSSTAQAFLAYRTQELDLEGLYFLGNTNQTGLTLDGTGNYTGGTLLDDQLSGFGTAVNAIGHQAVNPATTDWTNASAFVRLHIDCPTNNGSPISGTYGINLQQGDGNTFTGGDIEGCSTALHLGTNAQNNTVVGLRNENSTNQVVADAGSAYNDWITGGTMFTGKLTDNGTRNSFLDTFHRSFNGLSGDWYGSQQDATVTNHYRLGIGNGNERGLLDRYQTDYGYRWTSGLSDATAGEQFYQVLDELNNVYRLSIGQYNNGQSSTNNQTALNAAGTGAVVLNGSNNSGTGGVIFGSGGPSETTVATINNGGNAQFNGTLQVGGTAQAAGTMTVRNNADAEVDYYLWPGLTTSQKGSFTYKDWNGNSQWYMLKDASDNWALNSAPGGLDSFKAYQSTNSGDTYIDSSNSTGHIRFNYEIGSGSETDIYSGSSANLDAAFLGPTSIKFPGLAALTGHSCLQVDSSGYLTNTGTACGTGSGGTNGTISSGNSGQIAYYTANGTTIGGMNAVPLASGGTGATTASGALANLGGEQTISVTAYGAVGDCTPNGSVASCTDNTAAIQSAINAAYTVGGSIFLPFNPATATGSTVYYAASSIDPKGVSIHGPSGTGVSGFWPNVFIRGGAGKDVFAIGDPASPGYVAPHGGFVWQDFGIDLDDSIDVSASNIHRKPGKTCQDVSVTHGSAAISSTSQCEFVAGDIGQNVTLTDGVNTLATTIASVGSNIGYGSTTATLAANWTYASGANRIIYVSLMGMPTSQRIGNCALAYDDTTASGGNAPNSSVFRNLRIMTTTGLIQNNTCAFFFQGTGGQPYATIWDNIFWRTQWGLVAVEADNAGAGTSGSNGGWGDLNLLQKIIIQSNYPLLTYDGNWSRWEGGQMTNAKWGPEMLIYGAPNNEAGTNWNVQDVELESQSASGGGGWRISGSDNLISNSGLMTNVQTTPVQWDALSSKCVNCQALGTVNLTGRLNNLEFSDLAQGVAVNDTGFGNKCALGRQAAPADSTEPALWQSCSAVNSRQNIAFAHTSDFVANGNESTPYNNQSDLWIWPQDLDISSGVAGPLVMDTASEAGAYVPILSGNDAVFQYVNGSQFTIGQTNTGPNFPTQKVHVCFRAKADSGSGTVFLSLSANSTSVGSASPTLTTSYSTSCFDADLSSYSGEIPKLGLYTPSVQTDLAWISVHPWPSAENVNGPVNATGFQVNGSAFGTGNLADWTNTGITSGYVPIWNSTTSQWKPGAMNAAQVNGGSVPASANVLATNASSQPAAATAHNLSAPRTCLAANSGNAYTCTTSPTFTPAAGDVISVDFNAANTGNATLAVNGGSAYTIYKNGGTLTLSSGDLQPNHWVSAILDSNNHWQLEGQLGNVNATQINGGSSPASAMVLATNSSGQLVSMSVPAIASAASTTSTSLTSTGIAFPSVPASTTVHGTCAIIWEGSSTSYSTTFGMGANNAPTDLWVLGTMHGGANGGTLADKYTAITSTTATTVTTAGTPGAATTGYRADIDFMLVTGTNPVTLTLYYESSNSSGTSSIEPGSACWLM